MKNFFIDLGKKILEVFLNDPAVKEFVVHLLEEYAKKTDNGIDDAAVALIREKLLGGEAG